MEEFARVYWCDTIVLPPGIGTWVAGTNRDECGRICAAMRELRFGSLLELRVRAQSGPPREHRICLVQGGRELRRENPPRALTMNVGLYKVRVRRCVPQGRRRRRRLRVVTLVRGVRACRYKGVVWLTRGGCDEEVVVDFLNRRSGDRRGVVGLLGGSVQVGDI